MKCLLDMDGVLTDLFRHACALFGKDYDELVKIWKPGSYDFCEPIGIMAQEFWDKADVRFWRTMPKTRECDFILRMAEETFDKVYILTSHSGYPKAAAGKVEWIAEHLPQYSDRLLIGIPKDACSAPGNILFDDSDANIANFREDGGYAFLVPRPWNSAHWQGDARNTLHGVFMTWQCILKGYTWPQDKALKSLKSTK